MCIYIYIYTYIRHLSGHKNTLRSCGNNKNGNVIIRRYTTLLLHNNILMIQQNRIMLNLCSCLYCSYFTAKFNRVSMGTTQSHPTPTAEIDEIWFLLRFTQAYTFIKQGVVGVGWVCVVPILTLSRETLSREPLSRETLSRVE